MPELPEVESFRRYVEDHALHRKIQVIKLSTAQMLQNTTLNSLKEVLESNTFVSTYRHGKFLFIKLKEHGFLMLHFGMTGELLYAGKNNTPPKNYILRIHFHDGSTFSFSDSRMLGKIALTENYNDFIKQRGYGPDALEIAEKEFMTLLSKRKAAIKTVLMNQKIIAGIGNEFSDAILFQCSIHPLSAVNHLKNVQVEEVFEVTKKILKEAVKVNADRDKLNHYFLLNQRKEGLTCVRCNGKTAFKTIGGRSSYFCPSCQILPEQKTQISLFGE